MTPPAARPVSTLPAGPPTLAEPGAAGVGDGDGDRPPRWRPSRAGVVNVWRYHDETFTFHKGRLLLRGPNGAGKSMALELLLPFLLDANASPTRLSSAAKGRGGLFDRLVTGGDGPGRVGYLWVEFQRGGGTFTVGVRLRTSTSTRKVTSDWFTTTQRVGDDVHLLDEHRTPLSRAGLVEAIGQRGRVHDSGDEHRDAVRLALFPGLSRDRYDAVILALLTLRREKISQDLSPARLSEILSGSLPPLDEHDLAEIAEGFERLDRRRDALAQLDADRRQVEALARRQRAYARAVLAGVSADVRAAATRRDEVTRRARQARAAQDEASERLDAVAAEDAAAGIRIGELAAELDTLRNLDAYRQGAQLEPLRAEVARLDEQRRTDADAVAGRAHDRDEVLDRVAAAEDAVADAAGNEQRARADLDAAADAADAGGPVGEAATLDDPDDAEGIVRAWARARLEQIAEVERAVRGLAEAVATRDRWDDQVETDRGVVERRHEEHVGAARELDAVVDAYRDAVTAWATRCHQLAPGRLAEVLPSPPDDADTVTAAVAALAGEVRQGLAVERAGLDRQRAELAAAAEALRGERAELVAGRTPEPEPPPWRSPRDGRVGLPLWRLLDFRPDCPEPVADAVEAALEAAGLLDAWVHPDGRVDLPEGLADTGLSADAGLGKGDGHGPGGGAGSDPARATLADVLVALEGTAVPPGVTEQVLTRVAMVDGALVDGALGAGVGTTTVGRDGTFALGTLRGRGRVQPASRIGATAQERQRARRIREIDDELAGLDRADAAARTGLDDVERREAAVAAEVADAPDGRPMADAARAVELADARLADAGDRLRSSEEQRGEAEQAVRGAQRLLMQLAATHRLPTTGEALDEHRRRADDLGRSAGVWARRRREHAAAARERDRAAGEAERVGRALHEAEARLAAAEARHGEVASRLQALEATVGAAYQEVVARIEAADAERHALGTRREEVAREVGDLRQRLGRLEAEVEETEARRVEAEAARDAAHESFQAAVADGLPADAGVELDAAALAGVTAVLDAARAVVPALGDVSGEPAAVSRAQVALGEAVHTARQGLAGRVDVTFEQTARGWWLLRAATDGLRHPVRELADTLAAELATAHDELAEEEQRLFEETLTGSVRQAVADRIRAANELVDGINDQLAQVRTAASGVGVRLRWEVDPEQPAVVRSARQLLLKHPADLTEAERTSLHEFFRTRLDQARAELDEGLGWEARLREVLDHRRWHRFSLEVAHRDWDGFQPATANRLQRLSTGERSIALHLPMLASIAAHYAAEPGCPRLILLDELFAGVDTSNRGQLFGMLVAWDLDCVLTSDHEWCAYASLDAIAIHHLHPSGGDGEPVTSSRFVWDGHQRRAAPLEPVG